MARLTIDQIENARRVIVENARSLVEEAELLQGAGHHARAYALSPLSTEEIAKLPMLARAAVELDAGRTVDWDVLNRRLSNHKSKISMLYVFERFVSGEPPGDLGELIREREAQREVRNRKKNEALYSHLQGDSYRRPAEAITPDEARDAVTRARRRVEFFGCTEETMRGAVRGSGAAYNDFMRRLEEDDPESAV